MKRKLKSLPAAVKPAIIYVVLCCCVCVFERTKVLCRAQMDAGHDTFSN